jgi:hypothetical protein
MTCPGSADFEHRDRRQGAAGAEGAQWFEPRSRSASHRLAGEAMGASLNRARMERPAASGSSGGRGWARHPRDDRESANGGPFRLQQGVRD